MKGISGPICDYCGDNILEQVHYIEWQYRGDKWHIPYIQVDIGCLLLLKDKGIIDEMWSEE